MSLLTERLLKATHEENCCCEECKCEEYKENLSEEEINQIINEKYSEKDEKTKEFIRRGLRKFGDRFDYSKTEYKNAHEKVIITCLVEGHGDFEINPSNFLTRGRCQKCGQELYSKHRTHTTEQFIVEARKIHGDQYDYSKVNYVNNNTKIIIICPIHGEFLQTPSQHLSGSGCPLCANNIRLTTEQFIERAREIHGDKYDYSKVNYINANTHVKIICPIHGEFLQTPSQHLSGHGCLLCAGKVRLTTEQFIERAREIHGDKYDYSKVNYINRMKDVIIICPIHGEFLQRAGHHLSGVGCPRCGGSIKLTTEEFVHRANEVHGEGTYLYYRVNYVNAKTPIEIYDPIFDEFFFQTPDSHLCGAGNPNRSMSSGERMVYTFLKEQGIQFEREIWLDNTFGRSGGKIRVDFYLKDISNTTKNIIIEYNGVQHYKYVSVFHKTKDDFKAQLQRDIELRDYCKNNLIYLVEIPYIFNEYSNISNFLTKTIIEGIDPHMLIDYDALYVVEDNK